MDVSSDDDVQYCAEIWDKIGNYCGMVTQHKSGKWAASWNMIPTDELSYYLETLEDAIRELIRKYRR